MSQDAWVLEFLYIAHTVQMLMTFAHEKLFELTDTRVGPVWAEVYEYLYKVPRQISCLLSKRRVGRCWNFKSAIHKWTQDNKI